MNFSDIEKQNLCLYIDENSNYTRIILYHTQNIYNSIGEICLDGYVAFGRIEKDPLNPYKCYSVAYSSAKKGYGAWLYDVMLAMAGKKGICPDRGSVTSHAQKIWEYYFYNRSDEITTKPIDDEDNPLTKSKTDDSYVHYGDALASDFSNRHPIDYVYFFKNPQSILSKLSKLESNHLQFLKKIKSTGFDSSEFLKQLEFRTIEFFMKQKEVRGTEL